MSETLQQPAERYMSIAIKMSAIVDSGIDMASKGVASYRIFCSLLDRIGTAKIMPCKCLFLPKGNSKFSCNINSVCYIIIIL